LTLEIPTPRWAEGLLTPSRYKAAYGGRGSGKSHFFAELLLERCMMRRCRAVCIREVQNTIRESVRQLLLDKIGAMGLQGFSWTEPEIRGPNESLIVFRGMQAYNAENIKSLEDFDVAWVEEAQTLSQRSLDLLRPTIRSEGSELWFSWNPRHETDPVDKLFRAGVAPPDSLVVPANWQDNPWFPPVLKQEMRADYASDAERADHVWGGGYETVSEASYYAKWLTAAEKDGRMRPLERIGHRPLMTAWDLGWDDYTAIWFLQEDGVNAYVLDFYETQGESIEELVRDQIAPRGCLAGPHYVPHDGWQKHLAAGGRSIVEQMQALGLRGIRKGVAGGPDARIPAVRAVLPLTHFNDARAVHVGLSHLRRYARKRNERMGVWLGPEHDEHSHAADAFGEFAVNSPLRLKVEKPAPAPKWDFEGVGQGRTIRSNVSLRDVIERKAKRREFR
jgi:phage terminase large subunit